MAPPISERFANLECRAIDTRLLNKYRLTHALIGAPVRTRLPKVVFDAHQSRRLGSGAVS